MNSTPNQPGRQLERAIALGLVFLGCQLASAQVSTLWVDAARGNDRNPGTTAKPLQTLGRAIALAQGIPSGAVSIKLKPGTYPVVPNTTITRDHLSIEGLSNPILDANGLLNRFATPVTLVPASLGDTNLWINALFLIRASDFALTGLSIIGVPDGQSENLLGFQFEGQWPSPSDANFSPRALMGESVRLCYFNNWLVACGFNYASGSVEQCKVEKCYVCFYFGPSPGGAQINFSRNHGTLNEEATIQACGTPEFWSAPAQPASLTMNISGNLFDDNFHISPVEFFIRDYTPSAMDQPGYLDARISGNIFRNNALGDLNIVDEVHNHYNGHVPTYNANTAPVTIHLALSGNAFLGPEPTGQFTFQQFTDLYATDGTPLFYYPWIPHFAQNATVIIDDPESELADCVGGTRSFQYRIRQSDNDLLLWNGRSLTGAIPDTGFGVTVPPCP